MLFIDYHLITAAAVIIQLILVKSISNNNITKEIKNQNALSDNGLNK